VDAKKEMATSEPVEFEFTERDVILYNLGIGATAKQLQWVFEGNENFQALPTFGVIPQFGASSAMSYDFVPNFNPVRPFCAPLNITELMRVVRPNCFTANNTSQSKGPSQQAEPL
jgi:hypothetical protein